MVIIYYRKTCSSSKRALKWFDDHNIEYKKYQIERITKQKLLLLLSLTDNGIGDIVKSERHKKTREKLRNLYGMNLNEAIEYLQEHPEILRTPIIISHNKVLIGYHNTEIRTFIPDSKRFYERNI